MPKRIKSQLVEPAKRREWFRLYEEEGRSPTKIAEDAGYDVRTVKRAIEMERQERERKETRYLVLRNAAERHYADLCDFARKLDSQLGSDRITRAADKEDPLWIALHEHLPRSTIWRNLAKWESIRQDIQQLNKRLEESLEARIESAFRGQAGADAEDLRKRLFYILILHVKEAAQSRPEILQKLDFERIPESRDRQIRILVEDILGEVAGWEDYDRLIRASNDLRQVNRALHDELLTIRMRRVVAGRCRYCPV